MPPRSELPGEIPRRKFLKALERLGFVIDMKGGDGSHCKATWTNCKEITIQQKLEKNVLYYILKEIEEKTNVTWEDIKNQL